jgi:hypothetical protein
MARFVKEVGRNYNQFTPEDGPGSGSVTSVALTAPTGFTVTGSPITTSGTLALAFTTGYGIPPLMTGNSGKFLTTNGTIMSWANIAGTDVTGAAISTSNDTNILITASGNTTNALLRTMTLTAGWTGQLSVARGGTGAGTLTGVVIGNATANMTAVAGTAGQFLRRNTANTAYEFRTLQGSDIAGSELTKTDDTNVTISLGGTPASALLQPVSITLGWTGQLAVGRGGTGASTLTGVLIGNGTSAVSGVAGTSGQLLRRNVANTAYEFFTASLLTGNGTANFVPIWTSASNILESPLSFVSGEANFGSNKLVAGNTSAPNGSIMLQDNYSTGHLGNIGTMYSGGNLMLGYCVTPSTSSATAFLSATGLTDFTRSAIVLGTDVSIYTGAAQTVTVGSSVTMSERFRLENNGRLRLNAYTSSSSFTGIAAGYLAFTSGGYIITTATPGGVSGTQDYLAKFDSTGIAVGNSRIVDNGTNFLLNSASSYVTGLNLIGDIGMQSASGQASSIIMRSNQTPTSGTSIGIFDSYAITTGTTYTQGGGIDFRASQNWNSTSAGTDIYVQTAPDNTIAPADMFVFLNNGAVRFIGRTSNPLSPAAGTMYYNSSANNMRYYNGTSWITF